jgi:hydroxyacylglutathione hydrolase
VLLVAENGDAGAEQARTLQRTLANVGLDRVAAWAAPAVLDGRRSLDTMPTIDADALAAFTARADVQLVDVRGEAEWEAGHMPGALHLFLGDLPEESAQLRHDRPIVVACQGGTRSAIAASLLRARGFRNVTNFAGGFSEWAARGLAVETDDVSAETH